MKKERGIILEQQLVKVEKTEKYTLLKNKKWDYIKKYHSLYLLMIPGLLLTLIFKYFPMYGVLLAFKNYNPLQGIWGSPWVGFDHFRNFFQSPNFRVLLSNTIRLSFFELAFGFLPPIILAISLNQIMSKKWRKRIQLILYAPNFISVVIVVGMIFIFFSTAGPINDVLFNITGRNLRFLQDPDFFRPLYIMSGIWQGMGWASILYTSTLANVDTDLLDAAGLDGANIFQRIRFVDIPAMKPVMIINFILSVGGIMNVAYEKAYLMQTSLNLPASEILSTYVYKVGLQQGDYGYSTAVGLFNSVVNIILLLAVNQFIKKFNDGQGI